MKWFRWWTLGALVVFLTVTVLAGSAQLTIQVRSGQLRVKPSFLGSVVETLAYGTRVEQIGSQGSWIQVKTATDLTGWIHRSAVTEKKIVMTTGSEDVQTTASAEEVALAGKGFNEQVEGQYKAQNQNLDYSWVDWMEKIVVTPQQAQRFLTAGEVKPPLGGES